VLHILDQRFHEAAEPLPVRNLRSARTRDTLRASFLQLLEQRPLGEVTVRDIVRAANINYTTFFRHYPDKDALLKDVAAHEISQLLAMTLPILFTVDSRASAHALCAYVAQHRALWSVLLTGGAAMTLKQEFIRQARQIAANATYPDKIIPADLRVTFCVSGTLEILSWWLKCGKELSVEHIAEILDMLTVAPHVPRFSSQSRAAPATGRPARSKKASYRRASKRDLKDGRTEGPDLHQERISESN
jgi:AcrR family transcriptional regulator